MTKQTLFRTLEKEDINSSYISMYFENHRNIQDKKSPEQLLQSLKSKQLYGVLNMCSPFRKYFSKEEYSKLVSKKLISFLVLKVGALSASSEFPRLNVSSFAKPCRPLPKFLNTVCRSEGTVLISRHHGSALKELKV